jgi:serine/threonine-protein kinase RsbT
VPNLIKEYEIKAGDFIRAGEGSIQLQGTLKAIGFPPDIIRRASVCAYEAEMNAVMHGSDGILTLTVDDTHIVIEVKDNGPGIEDIELALQEGYSTASVQHREMGFGAGMGLPNIKKNADSLEIQSQKGESTYLKICFRVNKDGE